MSTELELKLLLSAQDSASAVISKMLSGLGPVGGLALGVTAAIAGIGVTSVKMATDFQTAMLQNVAHAGLAKNQVQGVTDALMQMGPAVGQGPTQLAQAMYPILSGFSGITNQSAKTQVSLTELSNAAKSVAGSSTPVSTAALAMTQTFNALGLQTDNTTLAISRMNTISDVANQTITEGNMKWQDYANVAGKLATAIKGTGVSWDEASAALATMTNEGFSAQRSQTYLSNLFTQMDLKTGSLAKNFDKLFSTGGGKTKAWNETVVTSEMLNGKLVKVTNTIHHAGTAWSGTSEQFDQAKFSTMNLADQIAYLNKITHEHGETTKQSQAELLKIFGNNATALKTFNALSSGINNYNGTLKDLHKAQGTTNDDFSTAKQGFGFQLQQARAAMDVLFIKIGTDLLPKLGEMLNKYVIPLIQNFTDWVTHSNFVKDAMNELGVIIGDVATVLGDIFGWLGKNQWVLYLVRDAAIALGIALASMKVLEFATGIGTMFAKLSEGDGIVSNLADKFLSKFLPNVKAAFFQKQGLSDAADTAQTTLDGLGQKIDALSLKVDGLGSAAETAAGEEGIAKIGSATQDAETVVQGTLPGFEEDFATVEADASAVAGEEGIAKISAGIQEAEATVTTETAIMQTHIEEVGTAADNAAGEEGLGKIGPAAVEAEGEVATQSGLMSGALASVGGVGGVGAIAAALGTLGPAAYQAGQDVAKNLIAQVKSAADQAQNILQTQLFNNVNGQFAGWTQAEINAYFKNTVGTDPNAGGGGKGGGNTTGGINNTFTGSPTIQRHATGGMIAPGDYGYVDRGELLYGGSHGISVYTASQTQAILSGTGRGGGGHTFNIGPIYANSASDGSAIAAMIRREVADLMRSTTVLPSITSGGRL